MLIWPEDAPVYGCDGGDEGTSFIDEIITCKMPNNNPELRLILVNRQIHRHSQTCKKSKAECRFNFPQPPMNSTKILYPLETDMCETGVRKHKDNWKNISKHLNDQPRSQDLSSSHKREWSKKDPGSGWSHASQKVGGDKKTMRGRYNQVIILSFLNPLLRGKIYVKYNTSYMCHSIGCELLCKVKCYRLRKRFIQRLVTQRVVVGFAKL